jgi:hypothetical protein
MENNGAWTMGFVVLALVLLGSRNTVLGTVRAWLLKTEISRCQAKADALGFGSPFSRELAEIAGTAHPGDVFRLFVQVRGMHEAERRN